VAGIHLVPPLAGPGPAAPGDLSEAEHSGASRTSGTGMNRPGVVISPLSSSPIYFVNEIASFFRVIR
jgi:hypothetical protein